MPGSRQLISSQVLSTSAASVTFSAIPATYTDLVVKLSTRTTYSSAASDYYSNIRFNSVTTVSYSMTAVYGRNSSAISVADVNEIRLFDDPYTITSAGSTVNTFANNELYIPNYLSTTKKPVSYDIATENNSASAGLRGAAAGLFDTSSAITSISFIMPLTFEFAAGSSFYLYGIKSSGTV